jgi:hypothetical protein
MDLPGLPDKSAFQSVDLSEPSIALRLFHGKLAASCEFTQNQVRLVGEKVNDASRIVRAIHGPFAIADRAPSLVHSLSAASEETVFNY